jgi:SHS2 domain-containing protein
VNPAVTFLDHTADVGIAVRAATLDQLFGAAAGGMLMLLRGEDDEDDGGAPGPVWDAGAGRGRDTEVAELDVAGDGRAAVLAGWLRELLFLHETRHLDLVGVRFSRLDPDGLSARVALEPARPAVREIKGVTLHGLQVEETPDGWRARVIFDV